MLGFLLGFLGAIPGTFFGMLWWMERTARPSTARQKEIFREIRHGIDEARREIESDARSGTGDSGVRAVYLALGVLRAAQERYVLVSWKNAQRVFLELQRIFAITISVPSLSPIREIVSITLFNANTLMLTFEIASHEIESGS